MDETVADESVASAEVVDSSPPERLGRYRLDRLVGAGQMGVVFQAFDPDLERVRAIKLMQPVRRADAARARFLREAKAMAKLEHPNVVAVQDVGVFNERVFVVMEFVDGPTLRVWLHEPRTWEEILERYLAAGRGLAAAHKAGLIHRDFKPDNVLVTADGGVKVTDFGLVREQDEPAPTPEGGPVGNVPPDWLTRTGALLGTPAYMPPESVAGAAADPSGDQYSYCVSLYEGLYGQAPHRGVTFHERQASATAGRIRDPPDTEAPAWIFDVVRRGLDPDPKHRWPSMNALLAALDPKPRTRRRWLGIAVAVVVLCVLGFMATTQAPRIRAWFDPLVVEAPLSVATVVEPMERAVDPQVGAYVRSRAANKGRAAFAIDVPRRGRYYLWGLVWEEAIGGDRGDADSFLVYVDGGEERLWHVGCQNEALPAVEVSGNWRWQRVHDMPNADSDCALEELYFDLSAGRHEVVIRNREDAASDATAARLSRLVLTDESGWVPQR